MKGRAFSKRPHKSQKQLILEHLQRGNTITPMEAAERFNCWRLAARILELRKDGWDIETGIQVLYGRETARYHLQDVEYPT